MGQAQVKLTVSDPIRLSPRGVRHWFPRLFVLPDGRIWQFDVTADDKTEALREERGSTGRLADADGLGWREIAAPRHYSFPVALKNGTVRTFSYINWHRDQSASQFAAVADLDLDGLTWIDRPKARVNLPTRAVEREASVAGMEIDRSILLEPDGSLLATMYGVCEGDVRFRCLLVRSVDDGATWDYVSTIAYDPTVGTEGFGEPVMARVKDGSLLVLMRTGGFEPIYQTRSTDDGRTWSAPQRLDVRSVDPDLCLMRNGVLACSFGRPTVQLMFSLDGSGDEWTAPHTIYAGPTVDGKENSTCYTGLRQVADGRLLLVYDTNSSGSPWEAADNQINAVFIDVGMTS